MVVVVDGVVLCCELPTCTPLAGKDGDVATSPGRGFPCFGEITLGKYLPLQTELDQAHLEQRRMKQMIFQAALQVGSNYNRFKPLINN